MGTHQAATHGAVLAMPESGDTCSDETSTASKSARSRNRCRDGEGDQEQEGDDHTHGVVSEAVGTRLSASWSRGGDLNP